MLKNQPPTMRFEGKKKEKSTLKWKILYCFVGNMVKQHQIYLILWDVARYMFIEFWRATLVDNTFPSQLKNVSK